MPAPDDSKRRAARETIDILHEISTLLVRLLSPFKPTRLIRSHVRGTDCAADATESQNTQLDRHTLSYCVSLIENGVNPEALAVRTLPFLFYSADFFLRDRGVLRR